MGVMNHLQHLASSQEPSCLPTGTFPLSCVDEGPEVWAVSMRHGHEKVGGQGLGAPCPHLLPKHWRGERDALSFQGPSLPGCSWLDDHSHLSDEPEAQGRDEK